MRPFYYSKSFGKLQYLLLKYIHFFLAGVIHRGNAGFEEVGSNVPVVGGIEQGSNYITPHQTSFISGNAKHVYQPGKIKEQRKYCFLFL